MAKSLSKKTRFEVFKRDSFTCQYCGRTPPTVILQADHVIPRCEGGDDSLNNLIAACEDCNQGKGGVPLDQVPLTVERQMEIQKERAAQVAAFNEFLVEQRKEQNRLVNALGMYWYNQTAKPRQRDRYVFGDARARSIKTFLAHLAPVQIIEAMEIAHARVQSAGRDKDEKTWRYFCGICWRTIRPVGGDSHA